MPFPVDTAFHEGKKLQKKRPDVTVNTMMEDEKAGSFLTVKSPSTRRKSSTTLRSALAKHLADLAEKLEKPSTNSFSTASTAYVKQIPKGPPPKSKYFKSRRINKDELDIGWLQQQGYDWIGFVLPILGSMIGLTIASVIIWNKTRAIVNANYCPVLLEDWSNGFNENVWMKEVQANGFGYVY
jgi:hypothetical protein